MKKNGNALDNAWENDFIVELRLRDVDGRTIGDALAQVRSHCAESGQPMRAAFGEPATYAQSLDLPTEPARELGVAAARSVIGLVAMFLTLWGFTAWLDGQGFALTVGRVAALVLLTGAVLLIGPAIGFILRHPWVSSLVIAACVASIVLAEILLTQELVVVPALIAIAVGVGALLATSLWDVLSSDTREDPVIDPVTGHGDDSRAGRVLVALTPWVLPIATLLSLLLVLVLNALT